MAGLSPTKMARSFTDSRRMMTTTTTGMKAKMMTAGTKIRHGKTTLTQSTMRMPMHSTTRRKMTFLPLQMLKPKSSLNTVRPSRAKEKAMGSLSDLGAPEAKERAKDSDVSQTRVKARAKASRKAIVASTRARARAKASH